MQDGGLSRASPPFLSSCVIFSLALAILLVITWGVFEAMPHLEDEFANYFQAQVFASGRLWVPSPPQPDSFLVPFAIDMDGRRFSKYPPGFAAVLALGVAAGVPWLVNPLIGALSLSVLYAIGRDVFDAETGWLAALLGLLSPMFLGLSSTLLSHSLNTLCLLTFTWAYIKISNFPGLAAMAGKHPSLRRRSEQFPQPESERLNLKSEIFFPLLGGVALGWAALTRPYTALVYATPFVLLVVRTHRRSLLGAFAVLGLVSAALAALLPLYGHALTGHYWVDLYSLVWPYDRLGFGAGHGLLPGGHTLKIAVLNAYVDVRSSLTELLGWPYLSWLPVLLGLVLPPRRRIEGALLAPFVAVVLAHGAYWIHGAPLFGPRYYYEAVPLMWLLAARGLLKLWRALSQPTAVRAYLLAGMRVGLAVLIGLGALGVMPARFEAWRGLYGITREPRRQIARLDTLQRNALIFVRIHHWGDYSELAWTNSLALDGDIVFALDEGPQANDAVRAAFPGRRVFYLDGHVLTELKTE